MSPALAVCRRELRSALNTAPAYLFAAFFLAVSSVWLFLVRGFFVRGEASLRPYFEVMPALFAVLLPALTMRSWAEERRSGTYEILATLPLRPGDLVAGKHLAVTAVVGVVLVLSFSVPLSVSRFGDFDSGVLFTEYLGALALASACSALGQYVSSRSRSPAGAYLGTSALLLALSAAHRVPAFLALPGFLARTLVWISPASHFESFVRGVLDSRDLAYFGLLTFGGLYLAAKALVREAWK